MPFSFAALVSLVPVLATAAPPAPTAEALEQFERSVRPILVDHCVRCHGEKKQQAGLRLDTADGVKKGADGVAVVVPGDPEKSSLVKAIRRAGDSPMPPDSELTKDQVAALETWVKAGAAFPTSAAAAADPAAGRKHWAYQPVKEPAVPAGTAGNPIDRFLNAKLAEKGIHASAPADKRTLARRIYFDLTGLPPSADDLDAFEKDPDPRAYSRLVDRLLASPHYGERWGRYWLDVARYADTKGYVFTEDRKYTYAWTYRDYVIRSFNEDKPYDRFVKEQLAADLIPTTPKADLAALGFLTVGRRFNNNANDIIDDRIDLVTRGLMGLTVACARCHDHKYDPIPAADYYSLYGVFAGCNEPKEMPVIGDVPDSPGLREYQEKLAKLKAAPGEYLRERVGLREDGLKALAGGFAAIAADKKDRVLNQKEREGFTKLQNAVADFESKSAFAPPRAMVLNDNPAPFQPVVFLRGNPGSRGPQVPRRMPEALGPRENFGKTGSGRLEMARAIASPANPLTARVFVNRVWLGHFGNGLIRTPSDFGVRTGLPPQPELLDWLASQFVKDGWSVKALHRRILLSDAYQRSNAATPQAITADPENLYLGRQNRRRLDFESSRDSLLVAAGQLDTTAGGKSINLFAEPYPSRRAVYAFIDRQNLPGTFRAFDLASPDQHTPQRFQTTVPQQALYLMNNPFAVERARGVVQRPEVANATDPAAKVKAIYRAVLSRNPTVDEAKLALDFHAEAAKEKPALNQLGAWEQFAQVLLLSNEFLFVD